MSWASWIRGMHKIVEALWTVHELQADIAVACILKRRGTKKVKMEIFRRSIKPNRGMRLRMGLAWSMVSMIQEPM